MSSYFDDSSFGRSMAARKPLKKSYVNNAIVICESFNERFSPVTLQVPRVLIPIVGVPLVDHTIEFLSASGINNIYLFSVSHADQIAAHVAKRSFSPGVKVECLTAPQIFCMGDVLRYVGRNNVVEGDFVLVRGDLVSNLRLEEALHEHRTRYEANPRALCTIVFKKASPSHRSKSREDATVVGMTRERRLVFWENDPRGGSVEIDASVVSTHKDLAVHYGLLDTYIDICSREILDVFSENFDYRDRSDWLPGVLGDEIYQYELYCYVLKNEYAVRVTDLGTYASVSRDIIRRWTHPNTVESRLWGGSFRADRNYIYRERGVKTHSTSYVGADTVIARGTTIGPHSIVCASVLGRNCKVGENVRIENSFIWGDCVIEDGAVILNSLLCDKVVVKRGAQLGDGCVLSFGVVVGADVTLERETKLLTLEVESTVECDLGDDGEGRRWVQDEDEHQSFNSLVPADGSQESEEEDEDTEEEEEVGELQLEEEASAMNLAKSREFDAEVRDIVVSSMEQKTDVGTVSLEINSRKFAHDTTFYDCARSILRAFLEGVPIDGDVKAQVLAWKRIVAHWHPLLDKYITEPEDQAELVWALCEFLDEPALEPLQSVFQHIVHHLYNHDLVEEDAILAWAKESEELEGSARKYLENAKPLLTWLQEADSDSDSSE